VSSTRQIHEPEEAAEPISDTSPWRQHLPFAVWSLLALACLYTVYFARALLFPFVLSFLLSSLLRPVVNALSRLRIPVPVGAAIVLIALLGGTAAAMYGLSTPAATWMARAPESLRVLERTGGKLLRPLERFRRTAAQVDTMAGMDAPQKGVARVEVQGPGFGAAVFGGMQELASLVLVVVPLLYLLLASGDSVLRALVRAIPRLRDKKRAVDIARETERQVSTYLFTLSLINLGLGIAVAIGMALIGLPNPALWGVIAAVLSYVPVFGGIVTGAVLLLAGTLTFDSVSLALLPVLVFAGLNLLQDYVVTPMVMGRRLTLSPIVLFVGVVFWWWLWGVPGSLLAVPMIAVFKIICDRTEALKPIGELIEGDRT